jgi:uncharacterized repeat protein (TIGR01451 family)
MSRRLAVLAFSMSLLPCLPGCVANNSKDHWVGNLGVSNLGLVPTNLREPVASHQQLPANQQLSTRAGGSAAASQSVQPATYQSPSQTAPPSAAGGSDAAVQTAYAVTSTSNHTSNKISGQNVVPAGFGHRAIYDPQCPPVHNCNPAAVGFTGPGGFAGAGGPCGCGPSGSCPNHAGCGPVFPVGSQPWDQQEYIFDGGDRDPAVVVISDGSVAGLQVEDTVMHYETEDGRLLVDPSCRTKIYAPRFAAVRKVTNVSTNGMAIAAIPASQPAGPISINDKTPSQSLMLGQQIKREDGVKLMEEVRDRNRGVPAEGIIPFVAINDSQRAMEDVDFIHSGIIREDQWWKVARGAEAALQWDGIDGVHIFIGDDEALQVKDTQKPEELYVYKLKEARVRICKVASDTLANPGDKITFTIRFDNSGEQPIKNIVILDSLSPRLEYIEASQTSSVVNVVDAANFSATPNEVGSAVLRWELKSELKPGEGGWIRFRCKVR